MVYKHPGKNIGHWRNALAHYSRNVILCLCAWYLANFVQKNSDLSQTNNVFRISVKNWVGLCVCQNFSSMFFFIEKFAPSPLQGWVEKWISPESCYYRFGTWAGRQKIFRGGNKKIFVSRQCTFFFIVHTPTIFRIFETILIAIYKT